MDVSYVCVCGWVLVAAYKFKIMRQINGVKSAVPFFVRMSEPKYIYTR